LPAIWQALGLMPKNYTPPRHQMGQKISADNDLL
jgi:hypothetical protein